MKNIIEFLKMIRKHYRPFAKPAFVVFALLMIGQILFLSIPYLSGKIIDNLADKAPFQDSLFLGIAVLAVYITSSTLSVLRERYELDHVDYKLPQFVQTETFRKLFRFSLGQHMNEHSGLRQSVISKGTSAIQNLMNGFVYSLLPFLLQIVLATMAIFTVNIWLGVMVFAVSFTYIAMLVRFNVNFYPKMQKNRDSWNKQSKHYNEMLRNVKLVKISAKEDEAVKEYGNFYSEVSSEAQNMWKSYLGTYYWMGMVVSFGQVGALLAGVWLVTQGVESPGKIVMLIGWMGSVFGNIGSLGWFQRQLVQQVADINKYDEMISREPAVKEAENPISLPNIGGKIEFRNVSFAYPALPSIEENGNGKAAETGKEILKNVSFSIEPGETVALVGQSGAGKTTIVNLILRGYDPDEGDILVDGVNLREIENRSYIRAIGYVPQFVELFDNTLRYNLAFATESPELVSEKDLEEIARKAKIDQFYDRLGEERFDVVIGENGIKLSGGERQRVGIARALLKQPEILIFDEATSNLDTENEALIHEAMREALKERTGIIIAHRLSTIRDADKIIVMDGGEIAGIGKHNELVESCEPYRKLVERQVITF